MNVRRLAPVIAGVSILGLWASVFQMWGRNGNEDPALVRPGAGKEVREKVADMKASVMGKSQETRGNNVVAPQNRPPKAYYDYTPREVCNEMKDRYPEQYSDIDCTDDKYSSPDGWIWSRGMQH